MKKCEMHWAIASVNAVSAGLLDELRAEGFKAEKATLDYSVYGASREEWKRILEKFYETFDYQESLPKLVWCNADDEYVAEKCKELYEKYGVCGTAVAYLTDEKFSDQF